MTSSYAVECPCCHYEDLMRPCRHAVAAIKVASKLAGLPQYRNVMDHRGSGRFATARPCVRSTQASLSACLWPAMRRSSIKKTSLRRGCTPGRAASGKSRTSHRSRCRECVPRVACRALHGQLSGAHHRPTVLGEATENHRSRQCASE